MGSNGLISGPAACTGGNRSKIGENRSKSVRIAAKPPRSPAMGRQSAGNRGAGQNERARRGIGPGFTIDADYDNGASSRRFDRFRLSTGTGFFLRIKERKKRVYIVKNVMPIIRQRRPLLAP